MATANDLNINQAGIVTFDGTATFNGRTLQPGTGVTITNGNGVAGDPVISLSGGGAAVEHLTGNFGGTLNPDGSNNFNIVGLNTALTGYSPWVTGSGSTLTVNSPGTVKWVVNATAGLGTHTTIQAAITAASAGDDVFITPGTYTENITGKSGVNLVAYDADSLSGQVTILGNLTFSATGTVNISGIELQTNSANCLTVSGSNVSVVNLFGCNINCSNNTGILFSSSNASSAINLYECWGNLGTTGVGFSTSSSLGTIIFYSTNFTNTGNSTTATTNSAGLMTFQNSAIQSPISSTGTGAISGSFSSFNCNFGGLACTINGTGPSEFYLCRFASSNNSAISVGTGAAGQFYLSDIATLSTAIVGAGTISYGGLIFESGGNSTITTTTQIPVPFTVQQGGTAKSSFTTYAPITGGTTTTGALQSASTGQSTAGNIFVSTGASSLPTFQIPTVASFSGSTSTTTTTSSTAVMAGFGSSWALTPKTYGNIRISCWGQIRNNTTADGVRIQLCFGTGVAPSAGAAPSGTTVGSTISWTSLTGLTTNGVPYNLDWIIPSLTPGTAYWFDLQFLAITGGTAGIVNPAFTAQEVMS
jgi:hypothetical protein